jgi:subtilisin-like proprotein convertase family protein
LDSFTESWEFTFMSVHHWGENPVGTWRLEVADRVQESLSENGDKTGKSDSWCFGLLLRSKEWAPSGKRVVESVHGKCNW